MAKTLSAASISVVHASAGAVSPFDDGRGDYDDCDNVDQCGHDGIFGDDCDPGDADGCPGDH